MTLSNEKLDELNQLKSKPSAAAAETSSAGAAATQANETNLNSSSTLSSSKSKEALVELYERYNRDHWQVMLDVELKKHPEQQDKEKLVEYLNNVHLIQQKRKEAIQRNEAPIQNSNQQTAPKNKSPEKQSPNSSFANFFKAITDPAGLLNATDDNFAKKA